jgi:hypothetical protein
MDPNVTLDEMLQLARSCPRKTNQRTRSEDA